MIGSRTFAQWYALLLGVVLLTIGIVGVGFAAGAAIAGHDFWLKRNVAIFSVDGWLAVVHLLLGLLGLATWRRPGSARMYATLAGGVYLIVGVWGLVLDTPPLLILDTKLADDVAHVVLGALGVACVVVSPWHLRPGTPRARLDYA